MQLRNAEIFHDVVTHRSFSRAAEAREISQPAASHAVQQLEEYLGTSLIDRSIRPFELTGAGEIYFEGCRRLFEGFRKVEDQVQRLGNRVSGRVRVASIYSVGLLQLTGYVERFSERYPETRVHLDFLNPDDVYDQISRDEADLGLVSFPREGGNLSSILWQEQEMGLIVPPHHELAGADELSFADLEELEFVGFTPDLRIRRQIDRRLRESGVSFRVVHQFDNVENIKRAVEIGAGVSILPLCTVRREVDQGSLVAIRFEGRDFTRPLGIIHRRNKHLSAAAERFIELLLQEPVVDDSPGTLVSVETGGAP